MRRFFLQYQSPIFWGSLFLLHLVFALYQLGHERYTLLDSEEYIQEAINIQEQGAFFSGDLNAKPLRIDHFTKRPPVYPLVLAGFQAVWKTEKAVIWLQLILSLFNFYLLFRMGQLLGWKQKHSFVLLPFLLLYPAQFIYTNLVMTEILFQTFLCLLAWSLLKAWRERQLEHLVWASFWIVLGMLTKPILYLFALPFLLLCLFWAWQWKRKSLVLLGLVPLLAVLLYASVNQQRTGYFHFSSIQNLSLLQYTTYNLLMASHGPEQALQMADSILFVSLDIPDYAASQKYLQKACFEVIEDHPTEYLAFHLKGMLNFFLDPGRFDLYHFFGLETVGGRGLQIAFSEGGYGGVWSYLQTQPVGILLLLLLVALGNGLKLLALLIFPCLRKVALADRLLLLLLILYIAGLTGVSGASRFAVPLFPLLLLIVGTAVERWKRRGLEVEPEKENGS
jgi:4-amino-4-deoxy-L-arabinose transferase-like glycosyltransferase